MAVQREKLYEQVWSIPVSQLSIMYGISDVGLAKVCKRYRIPRPPRGYWARKAVGQDVKRIPLPKADRQMGIVELKGWNMNDRSIQQLVEKQGDAGVRILADLVEPAPPHRMVESTRAYLANTPPDRENLLRSDGSRALDVHISPSAVDRCLGVLDLLIKRWESAGGSVSIGGKIDKKSTAFAIGPDEIYVRVIEKLDEGKPVTDLGRLTGRLVLLLSGQEPRDFRRKWSDTKTQGLEKMIKPLIETMTNVLASAKTARLDSECVQRQLRQANAREKADETRESREFYWRQDLMSEVSRWHVARQIREYLNDVKRNISEGRSKVSDEKAHQKWMDWCHRYADSIDPILNVPLPSDSRVGPTNTPIADLDLTSVARSVVSALNVVDTNELERLTEDQVREACGSSARTIWTEITRVLDGLGYPVSTRRDIW